MGKLRSSDEPVGRMAKLIAELYYFMAKEMTDKLGDGEGSLLQVHYPSGPQQRRGLTDENGLVMKLIIRYPVMGPYDGPALTKIHANGIYKLANL